MYKHYNSRQNNGIYIILIVTGKLNQIQSSKQQENITPFYKHFQHNLDNIKYNMKSPRAFEQI